MPKGIYKHKSLSKETKEKISLATKGKPQIGTGRLGKPLSEKSRKKMSEKMKGNKNPMFGKKHFEETKEKMSKAKLGKKMSQEARLKLIKATKGKPRFHLRGKNASAWKGGRMKNYPLLERLRKSLEYKLWRKAVFERDNYTCVWCGDNKGGNLNADHIKPFAFYPELRFEIDNGRTLCEECHKKTDTYGGKLNKLIWTKNKSGKLLKMNCQIF